MRGATLRLGWLAVLAAGVRGAFWVAGGSRLDDVYVMGSDGSNPTPLTNSTASETHPTTSSAGAKIVFRSSTQIGVVEDIYIMNADGSGRQLVAAGSAVDTDPSLSPDG